MQQEAVMNDITLLAHNISVMAADPHRLAEQAVVAKTAGVTAPPAAHPPGPQAYQPLPPPSQAAASGQRAHGAMSRPTSAGEGNYGAREKRVTARNTCLLKTAVFSSHTS